MPKLTKGANRDGLVDGRTDPYYRKSFAFKKNDQEFKCDERKLERKTKCIFRFINQNKLFVIFFSKKFTGT